MSARTRARLAFGYSGLLLALSCQSLIDAKDRTLDPSLSDAGTPSAACVDYCDTVMKNCVDSYAQYSSLPVCLADCSHLPLTATGPISGNSVECRKAHAVLAGTTGEPFDYCVAAGPAGNDVCGSTCESYCDLITSVCASFEPFDDFPACMAACRAMHDVSDYNTSYQRGNTVQCRIFHVSAATQNPKGHCPHAGKESTNYCVDSDAGLATSCVPPADGDDCDRCEYKTCCQEVNDCYNDAICNTADEELDACEEVAAGAAAASDQCQATFVATNSRAEALHTCKRQHCATECELTPLAP